MNKSVRKKKLMQPPKERETYRENGTQGTQQFPNSLF